MLSTSDGKVLAAERIEVKLLPALVWIPDVASRVVILDSEVPVARSGANGKPVCTRTLTYLKGLRITEGRA